MGEMGDIIEMSESPPLALMKSFSAVWNMTGPVKKHNSKTKGLLYTPGCLRRRVYADFNCSSLMMGTFNYRSYLTNSYNPYFYGCY